MKLRTQSLTLSALLVIATSSACSESSESNAATETAARRVEVEVGATGYSPSEIQAQAGTPLTLVFTRTTDDGCGEELVIADQNIRRDLPLNEAVEVTFTPTSAGSLRFSCGMDMYDGAIIVSGP